MLLFANHGANFNIAVIEVVVEATLKKKEKAEERKSKKKPTAIEF